MLTGFDEVCGKTKGRRDQRYTWWWNKDVKEVIVRKKDAHKEILRRTSQVQEHEELAKKVFTKAMKKVACLLYTSPSPRDLSTSRMPSSA